MFSFRLFVLIGVLIVVFLGVNLGKEYYREYQIQKEIGSLKKEIESLERDIYKFSQLAEYYETDEYKVAEARKRFGLGKEGEKLAIMIEPSSGNDGVVIKNKLNNENLPNYIKWWNYFFATKD